MNLDKENYSRNEVEQMLSEYETKISDLEKQIADFESMKQQYAELQKVNIAVAIKNEMLKAGLDESYFDLVESEDVKKAQEKINKLLELKKKQDIDNSYRPTDHKPDDSYSVAEKEKNVEGMIFSKLNKIFG